MGHPCNTLFYMFRFLLGGLVVVEPDLNHLDVEGRTCLRTRPEACGGSDGAVVMGEPLTLLLVESLNG